MGSMRLLTAAAVAFALGTTPAPALTWQDVRAICLEDQKACWFFILGVVDTVRNVHQDLVCMPPEVSADTAVVVVDAFAMRFPQQWPNLQAYDFVLAALIAAYPCGTGPAA